MADSPRPRVTEAESGVGPDRGSPPGAPRWVKVAALVTIVLALLVVLVLLTGGGGHGPGRHAPASVALSLM